jgi:acyl carrier protein
MNAPFKDTESAVRMLLCEQLGVKREELAPERTLADLGADSLDNVEIAMALEDEFSIEIADEELERVRTVEDLFALVKAKAKAPA